jgi:hypothetical protein
LRSDPAEIGEFKITFYSTSGTPRGGFNWIDGKTVAMNRDQMRALGLDFGDEIYIRSARGWSGYYTVGDTGCAWGTLDIYVAPGGIPSWGAENGAQLLVL